MVRINTIRFEEGNFNAANSVVFSLETSLMQFTGVHDKNGREIYELDVVLVDGQEYVVEDFWSSMGPRKILGYSDLTEIHTSKLKAFSDLHGPISEAEARIEVWQHL